MGTLAALAAAIVTAFPAADATRTCETRAEGSGGPHEVRPADDVVLGRVAFIGLRRRLQLTGRTGGDPTAKVPAAIGAGAPVTVRINPLARTRARLDFDQREWRDGRRTIARGAGDRSVRFEACPPDTPRFTDGRPLGDQTVYPGGFIVARPGCARLVARSPGDEVVRRRVALGVRPRRCRRQES